MPRAAPMISATLPARRPLLSVKARLLREIRHCEERSDEAIHPSQMCVVQWMDCFAIARPEGRASSAALWLAMTAVASSKHKTLYRIAAGNAGLPRIMSDAFSAIMIVGALVLLDITNGITEASTTRMPRSPRSLRSGVTTASAREPMAHVPAG